jgi:hypothetical protein
MPTSRSSLRTTTSWCPGIFMGRLTADMVGASHRLGMIHPSSEESTMWQTSLMPGMLKKSILRF